MSGSVKALFITFLLSKISDWGPHILASALTTVMGFAAACVLALPMAVSFGLLTGAAIALVYLASMLVLPVLLVRWGDRMRLGRDGEEPARPSP
jgi:predicted RND superfamily exporter protein